MSTKCRCQPTSTVLLLFLIPICIRRAQLLQTRICLSPYPPRSTVPHNRSQSNNCIKRTKSVQIVFLCHRLSLIICSPSCLVVYHVRFTWILQAVVRKILRSQPTQFNLYELWSNLVILRVAQCRKSYRNSNLAPQAAVLGLQIGLRISP